jgi:hypothetical protein
MHQTQTHEETFSTVQSLLSWDSVYKINLSEVWKTPKDQVPVRPFFQSYNDFTGILAYGMAHTKKSNDGISTWDFVHRQLFCQ